MLHIIDSCWKELLWGLLHVFCSSMQHIPIHNCSSLSIPIPSNKKSSFVNDLISMLNVPIALLLLLPIALYIVKSFHKWNILTHLLQPSPNIPATFDPSVILFTESFNHILKTDSNAHSSNADKALLKIIQSFLSSSFYPIIFHLHAVLPACLISLHYWWSYILILLLPSPSKHLVVAIVMVYISSKMLKATAGMYSPPVHFESYNIFRYLSIFLQAI